MTEIEMPSFAGPNAQQIQHWNQAAGEIWVAREDALDRMMAPIGEQLLALAAASPGEGALDVGCGCGAATLELARQVGPSGCVLGIDVSRPMLERALARARARGLAHLHFRLADAQTAELGREEFDLLFSRFGVMFFADPEAAFRNLRRALRAGGRLAFVCWQPVQRNPWMLVPATAIARHVPISPPEPNQPGPFALGDPERVQRILFRAGFRDVGVEGGELSLSPGGGDLDHAVEFALEIGPAAAALRAANAGPDLRKQAAESVREALRPFATGGALRMPAAIWLVHARCG